MIVAIYCLSIVIGFICAVGYFSIARYEKLIRDLQETKAPMALLKYHEKEFGDIDERYAKKYTNLLIIVDDMKKDVERLESANQSVTRDITNLADKYPILKLKVAEVSNQLTPKRKPGRPRKQ